MGSVPLSGTDPSGYISCDAAVQGKVKGGCTRGEDPSDPGSQWGKGRTIIGNYPSSGNSQSNGANQTASSTSASTQVPEINSPSEAGKTNDPGAETNPYGPYPPFSITRDLESYAIAGTEPNFRMVSPEVSFLIGLGISIFSGNNAFSGENAPGDDSIEGGAFSPLGVAKGVGAAAGSLILRRGASVEKGIDDVISSASRAARAGSKESRALQALKKKKIDRGDHAFSGLPKTQDAANDLIRQTLGANKPVVRTRTRNGQTVRDVFDPNTRRGVRTVDGEFDTFLNLK